MDKKGGRGRGRGCNRGAGVRGGWEPQALRRQRVDSVKNYHVLSAEYKRSSGGCVAERKQLQLGSSAEGKQRTTAL